MGDRRGRVAHSKFAIVATVLWLLAALMLGTLLIPANASGASPASTPDRTPAGGVSARSTFTATSNDNGNPNQNPGTNDPTAAQPFTVNYGTGAAQYYLAWIPPQPTSRIAVAVIHGGFWVSGSPASTASFNRKLYAAGIPSFSIGYRLATQARWPAQRTDTQAALDDIKSKAAGYGIDPRQVALVGSSAGGHIALAIASGAGRADVCAAITYSAPTSMGVVRADGAGDYRRQMLAAASNKLAPTPKLARSATVPSTPSRTDAPALLFAGQDEWMPYLQSSLYVQAYRGTGLDVRPVILSGISEHAMKYALDQPLVWRLSMEFLDKHC